MNKSPYYDNSLDEEIWMYTCMSRPGAMGLAKTMQAKFGCTILEQPMEREDGCWVIMFTNPFLEA
jgi:hypothetical protein